MKGPYLTHLGGGQWLVWKGTQFEVIYFGRDEHAQAYADNSGGLPFLGLDAVAATVAARKRTAKKGGPVIRPNPIPCIPGPWIACQVTRPDAGNLWNAARFHNNVMVEADATPTHSEAIAVALASDLNRKYHQAHGTGVPAPQVRMVHS